MAEHTTTTSPKTTHLNNVHLSNKPPDRLFNLTITGNTISRISPAPTLSENNAPSTLLLPSLCHPHIHLDKAYLFTSSTQLPSSSLLPKTGTFTEALTLTSAAKSQYTPTSLLLRGSQLIAESVTAGVTSMRAFVEIDHVTNFQCLEAALTLKSRFAADCYIQICAFAQDPLFSRPYGDENRRLMEEALEQYAGREIEALGTTPYVESSDEGAERNIQWAIATALRNDLHLDFHLDYNISTESQAAVWDVIRNLRQLTDRPSGTTWPGVTDKVVAIGHCTRLTLFSDEEMRRLAEEIREAALPVSFVGLPTSDLYMMGRPEEGDWGGQRPRGTMQLSSMSKPPFDLNCAMGVNNLGNAFTPYGMIDPLMLASLGVGLYHNGTIDDASLLYEFVSTRARKAIGLILWNGTTGLELNEGDEVNGKGKELLLFENESAPFVLAGSGTKVPRRSRRTIQDVVWDPPNVETRKIARIDQ